MPSRREIEETNAVGEVSRVALAPALSGACDSCGLEVACPEGGVVRRGMRFDCPGFIVCPSCIIAGDYGIIIMEVA